MTSNDLAAVMAIENEAQTSPWGVSAFQSSLMAQDVMPVAESAGKVVGFAVMKCASDQAELLTLAVLASCRRQGVAKHLLRFLSDEAKKRQVTAMFLEVRVSNEKAQSLYSGEGFYRIGLRKNYYPTPTGAREDALLYRKDL